MARRSLRRSLAALCTALVAAGAVGVAVVGPAGAGVSPPPPPATAPAPGGGVQVTVGEIVVGGLVVEQELPAPQPLGPLAFT